MYKLSTESQAEILRTLVEGCSIRSTERNNIETKYLRQGTGGKRLCEHCARLNREGK